MAELGHIGVGPVHCKEGSRRLFQADGDVGSSVGGGAENGKEMKSSPLRALWGVASTHTDESSLARTANSMKQKNKIFKHSIVRTFRPR